MKKSSQANKRTLAELSLEPLTRHLRRRHTSLRLASQSARRRSGRFSARCRTEMLHRGLTAQRTKLLIYLKLPRRTHPCPKQPAKSCLRAKLATVEARTETRFVELSGKIDRLADTIASSNNSLMQQITSSNNSLTQQVSTLRTDVDRDLRAVLADNKNTRWTVIITIIAATLAALAALYGSQANLLSAFQTGLAVHTEQQQRK